MTLFSSKRNTVYLDEGVVIKECKNHEAARSEGEFLDALRLKGVAVPIVTGVERNTLRLEYIDGKPLPDFLESNDAVIRCSEVSRQIIDWFVSFYDAVDYKNTKEIRGDINGRNFIITDNGVFGVDFEEHTFGRRETDLGRLLAYISSYSYADTTAQNIMKEKLLAGFILRLCPDKNLLLADKTKEIEEIKKRRGGNLI